MEKLIGIGQKNELEITRAQSYPYPGAFTSIKIKLLLIKLFQLKNLIY